MPHKLPPMDLKPIINSYINNKWQTEWDQYTMNKLHEISPKVGRRGLYHFLNLWVQIVYTCCQIGF